jgi:legumain
MMEDDVAGARENPFPGKMFNKPTAKGEPGVDVYAGCVPDYKVMAINCCCYNLWKLWHDFL